jgi:hypothetical protein
MTKLRKGVGGRWPGKHGKLYPVGFFGLAGALGLQIGITMILSSSSDNKTETFGGGMASSRTIYYCFYHQIRKETGWTPNFRRFKIDPDSTHPTWQNIRYLLEMKLGIADKAYLVAWPELDDQVQLVDQQRLVLKRIPLDFSKGHRKYKPVMFRADMSEEEKILFLNSAGRDLCQQQHASKILEKVIRVPPYWHECNFCKIKGEHYITECPRKEKGLPPRRLPKGVPMTFLRVAETEQEKDEAFLAADGRLLVLKEVKS